MQKNPPIVILDIFLDLHFPHDSTKLMNTLENTSYFLGDDILEYIVALYADKGYDAKFIRSILDPMEYNVIFLTKKIPNQNPRKISKRITIKRDTL